MEQEIIIEVLEWNSTYTQVKIPEFNFWKQFTHRSDAIKWINSAFKNPKIENITYP